MGRRRKFNKLKFHLWPGVNDTYTALGLLFPSAIPPAELGRPVGFALTYIQLLVWGRCV